MPTSEIAPPALAITLFGPLQVRVHGLPMPAMRSRKVLWLLALLTLRHDRPVQREWLAGTLWPDMDQSQAFANLRPVLSDLRRALAEQSTRLQSPDRLTLLLDLTDADVDLLTFDAAIQSGKLPDLERAIALYQGSLLEDCHEEWIPQERAVREQNCLAALLKLGEAAQVAGDYEKAVGHYQHAASLDPWSDTARRGWMEALATGGDSNAAMQVYRKYLDILRSDPSAAPDEKTSALYQRLRAEARKRASAPSIVVREPAPVPVVTGYLPHPLTDLVGQEDERLEVATRLRKSRLLTLTGLGGIGKTRMAIAVAEEVVGEYADGVWLVALEALSDGSLVVAQIASVLGLKEGSGQTLLQIVTNHLRAKRLLLVLDNCEHLLSGSAPVVEHLLRECVGVRILATSRTALGITGETVWAVPALTAPDPQHLPQARPTLLRVLMSYESVQLFVERAQAVQKGFALSGSNARMVAQTCQQLEGIPLAIELAAARVRAMSMEQIASRLDDYLGLLTGGSRTAQSRQQTLRATLDWSYALLSEAERSLLKRLSVFAGGCILEAAEQVCAGEGIGETQVLDLLSSLVDKSLVLFEERESAEGRYRLLEMVRQYAAEGLQASGEAELVRLRHRAWYLTFAEQAELALITEEQKVWLTRLESEHGNLRAALDWSLKEEEGGRGGEAQPYSPIPLLICGALLPFWSTRGYLTEGRAWCERALQTRGAQKRTAARAHGLIGAGMLATIQGHYAAGRAYFEECLEILRELGNQMGIAASLNCLGNVATDQGDYAAARAYYAESLTLYREIGDRQCVAICLNNLGEQESIRGDYIAARAYYEESLEIRRELGDRLGIASTLNNLGTLASHRSDYAAALTYLEESLEIRREIGDRPGIAATLFNLGGQERIRGDNVAARACYAESLAIWREIGYRPGMIAFLEAFATLIAVETAAITASAGTAELLKETDDGMQRAARLWGAAHTLREQIGAPLPPNAQEEYRRDMATACTVVGDKAFAVAWEEGQAMTLEQAVAYALKPEETSSKTQ
jgi:predicted ATPase/DNA-binding SARP family transcriptional activator